MTDHIPPSVGLNLGRVLVIPSHRRPDPTATHEAAERRAEERAASGPRVVEPGIIELEDDARWQAEEDAESDGPTSHEVDERITAKLLARETSAPRIVELDSIDAASLEHADRPSADEAHAADVGVLLARLRAKVDMLEASNASMAESLARNDAERRDRAARTERPRQHGRIVSLVLWMAGDR